MFFDFSQCTPEHQAIALRYIGDLKRAPDLIVTTDDDIPYLFRWHVVARNTEGNVYFHVQTSSDPERPLHDHPWENCTVILANGFDEIMQGLPPNGFEHTYARRKGDVVHRFATVAHRLILPPEFKYSMTQFSTGPATKKWGFWINKTWYNHNECTEMLTPIKSVFRYPPGTLPRDIEQPAPRKDTHGHF